MSSGVRSAVLHISASRRIYIYFLEIKNLTAKNTQPWGGKGLWVGGGGGGHSTGT
jgi:hypothetical protein